MIAAIIWVFLYAHNKVCRLLLLIISIAVLIDNIVIEYANKVRADCPVVARFSHHHDPIIVFEIIDADGVPTPFDKSFVVYGNRIFLTIAVFDDYFIVRNGNYGSRNSMRVSESTAHRNRASILPAAPSCPWVLAYEAR